jgi:STE24 endopeptidase
MYEGFTREHDFALSNQTYEQWFNEYLIGLGVGLVLGGIFLTVLYAIIRRAPNTWWIWGAGATSVFFAFTALVGPVFISPLFNDYKPMRDGELKQQILSLARANGIPVTDVFEVDASRQSKRISANVQGFLSTTRISLNDNLLNRSTPNEVRAVMAHEMGHYVLGHVNEMIAYITLMSLVAFAFTHWGFQALHRVFGGLWGIRDIADPAGLAVLSLLLSFVGALGTPVTNTMIRSNEAEADIFRPERCA